MASIIARRTKKGTVSWQVKIRRRGHPPVSRTFARKTDADRFARQAEADIDRGTFVSLGEAEAITLSEALDRYAAEVTAKKRGRRQEESRIRLWKDHPLALRALAAIRPADIAAHRDARLKAGASAATVRHDLALISHLYTVAAKEWGLQLKNPVSSVSLPPVRNARNRRLAPEEERRLLDALQDHPGNRPDGKRYRVGTRNPWVKPLVQLALETAMRRGELLSLRWENVDLAKRVALLPETKNGEARQVPLSSRAVAILESLPRSPDGRVFPITANALHLAWAHATRLAALKDLRFHDLRHEATSRLAEKLPNVIELSAVTGHKDLRMLKRYYHPRAEELAKKLA